MTDEEFFAKLNDLLAKADYIERHRIPQIEGTRDKIDALAAEIEPRDPYMAEHIRRFTSRDQTQIAIDRIRWFLREGGLAAAEEAVTSWQNHYTHIKELLMLAAVRSRDALSRAGVDGGSQPKRREWAVALAERLWRQTSSKSEAWELIPEHPGVLELSSFDGDFEIYRSGETVVCVDEDRKEHELKRSSFLKRYLPPGQQAP
jgi:hypothetical protein